MNAQVIAWPILITKACFSAGLVLLGMALFPWLSIVCKPLADLAAAFGFLPAWPFDIIFEHSYLVSIPSIFWSLALFLLVPSCIILSRMEMTNRICFIKQVANCLSIIGAIPFGVFCSVWLQYGTALAPNTVERERIILSFVPIGAIGAMLLLQSAVFGCIVYYNVRLKTNKQPTQPKKSGETTFSNR